MRQAEKLMKTISIKNLSVLNKFTDMKNNAYWAYYDIMESAKGHKAVSDSDGETWVK